MSFVQKLRMNNIFPTGGMNLGWSGQLPQYGGADPMEDITSRYAIPQEPRPMPRQSSGDGGGGALGRIAQQAAASPQLQFDGVRGGDSNPGADILRRATANAERIYAGYDDPQITAGEILGKAGIKANDQDPGFTKAVENLDVDKQLGSEYKRSQIEENKARTAEINNRENLTEDKAWKVITITDPTDPTKQINARYNSITNKTEPIVLPNNGVITNTTRQADMLKERDNQIARAEGSKAFKERAQLALDTLNQLSDESADGESLKDNTKWITGLSANFGTHLTPGGAAAKASVEQLRNLLTLDLLQEIKKQSKSGATGFGQMNLRELGVLENSASKLAATNMDEGEYAKELNKIRKKLTEILAQEGGFTGGEKTSADKTSDTPATTPSATQAPQAPEGWEYVRNAANNGWTARPLGSK
jgi:hypothetical protein